MTSQNNLGSIASAQRGIIDGAGDTAALAFNKVDSVETKKHPDEKIMNIPSKDEFADSQGKVSWQLINSHLI